MVVGVGGFKTGGKGRGGVAMPLLILGTGDVGLSKKCRYLSADYKQKTKLDYIV